MTGSLILIAIGLVALAGGGELLVRGAVGIANKLGVGTLFTGLVIVGAATSMPEMVASVQAVMAGSPEIAWGNIVGSNIANSLLILGGAALVTPIVLAGVGRRDSVVALLLTLIVWGIAWLRIGSPFIGVGLLAALVIYIVWRYRHPPAQAEAEAEETAAPSNFLLSLLFFALGVAALVLGGRWLVTGAIDIASDLGVSQAVIGLTIVAVGTSLPELAASAVAAFRGHAELALGNVLGSNIFNLLLIGGVTMSVSGTSLPPELLQYGWPICAASALLLVLMCRFMNRIGRLFGLLMLGGFAANTALAFS
ncbi:sodium:proton exchanger [Citromicrobium sp. RCC1885]|uniref:calcium/sodium antiporter n=1 Tax=unclassified Citromicrobium TaxID=2630544 RepID=UPI0006C8EA22|nr:MULTISPECIES: calcium/sodium antiporter [unclassified Citromicrobium]KPM23163.1 sodium:proton exchanger [Citromicrobium sp. RCC1885]KPM26570.1 sodium:proton exchanger [Citromicrobium sp. RCC1878]MAO04052.1 sodium:proton exchanger [Citromicrobium sp.]OAM08915.1 sodium:proton exchanger [Citromicrobium sp. RCC1897]|tara:strand:- start:577 stop:1503 length:927 start_codon:yes stop_codon:yes gene_type:complete